MSFTINTFRSTWTLSRDVLIGDGKSIWIAVNQDYKILVADSLDHLYIGIHQFEHPEMIG